MVLNRTYTQEKKNSETGIKEMVHINWPNGKSTDRKLFVQWKKILTYGW